MTRQVVAIEDTEPISRAARLMRDRHVGCLIVTASERGTGVGIITERDLVWRIIADNFDPSKVLVSDVMTTPLITIPSDQKLENATKLMLEYGVRRLPVVDNNVLVGIITTTDLAKVLAGEVKEQEDLSSNPECSLEIWQGRTGTVRVNLFD